MKMLRHASGTSGSILVTTLITLSALAILAAYTLMRATPNVHIAHQNASWREARIAAESGIDLAMNELLLNGTGFAPGAWTGWEEIKDPAGSKKSLKSSDNGLHRGLVDMISKKPRNPNAARNPRQPPEEVLSTTPLYLDNVRVAATASIPAETDIQLWGLETVSNAHARWYRIRSMGTCAMPPTAFRPPADMDSPLRRFSLKEVRQSLKRDDVGTAMSIPLPNISRTVEVLVEPILAFELALWTSQPLKLPATGTWSVDSFDSEDITKSAAGGLYPGKASALAQINGSVATSSPFPRGAFATPPLNANGTEIRGEVATNGGDNPETKERENVANAGKIDPKRIRDDFTRKMIPVQRIPGEFLPSPTGDVFVAGPVSAPSIYSIHGDLQRVQIASPLPLGKMAVVILVDGSMNLSAPLVIPPSVTAVFYVRGDITFRYPVNSTIGSSNRAGQLIIFGDNPSQLGQTLRALGNISVCASFYGPNTAIELDGDVNWMGSLNGGGFRVPIAGNGGIHYDEALATVGPPVGFRISRYIEDVRQ